MARKSPTFETDLNRYTADRDPIGQGGSGSVLAATGTDGERYAIKLLDSKATSAKVKRFANELNFGRRVRHDHIVPVIDSGTVEIDGTQRQFFVMPKYDQSFRALLTSGLEPDQALHLFSGVLDAVEFAHGRGVWHRDIKPENILHDAQNDRLLLADFGIAHFEQEDLHEAVKTRDERLANFLYAAPEQRVRGAKVDHRADIYALGLILNESITGSVPHGTGYRRAQSVSARHGFVDNVVDRMIRSAPEERYQSITEVKNDLTLLAAGKALGRARSVGAKVTAAHEKERLFRSREGIEAVIRQVGDIYDYIRAVLERTRQDIPALKLEFEPNDDELVVRSPRTSARINWYQAFGNVLEGARLTIRTYKWRLLLPSEQSRYTNSVQPEEMSKTILRPDFTADVGLCWRDESDSLLSVPEVGDRFLGEFFDLVERHENSDEEMPWG